VPTLTEAGVPDPELTTDAGTDVDWTVSTVRVPEGYAQPERELVFLTIKLDRPAPSRWFHVGYELEARTATAGVDFWPSSPQIAYFAPGESEKVIAVKILGDGEVECDEAVAVRTWLPNLPSKVRYGYVILENDDWEGPGPVWRDAGVPDAGGASSSLNVPDSGPTDVPLIKDTGPAVRLQCHDDPGYDPLAIPPPTLDGGADLASDVVFVSGPDLSGTSGGGAPDSSAGASDARPADTAVPGPDAGGCDCSVTGAGRPPLAAGLAGAVLIVLARRRARRTR
jgi:MYXO-CTERM domain-containing protein